MAIIRPNDLPENTSPVSSLNMVVDGAEVGRLTIGEIVATGRPLASQAEAEAGTQATKAMTPLTTAQAITAQGGIAFASASQGAKADTAVQPGDLSTVATSGAYADLTGKPTLGTAAAENVGYFGTAAQGALADTAVQPDALAAVAPALSADTMLVDNAAGTARESKGFGLIRNLLGAFDTEADFTAANIPSSINSVFVYGYSAVGDGGQHEKMRIETPNPVKAWHAQSEDGDWWQIVPGDVIRPEVFGAKSGFIIETATREIFDAFADEPTSEHLRVIDKAVRQLKRAASLWTKLGWLVVVGANKQQSLINWKNPGVGDFAETVTFTLSPGKGWVAANGTGTLTTGSFLWSNIPGFTQDSAHVGLFNADWSARDDSQLLGTVSTPGAFIIPQRATTSVIRARLNSATTLESAITLAAGTTMINRSSATEVAIFQNGARVGLHSDPSTGVAGGSISLFGTGAGTITAMWAGQSLTDAELMALSDIITELAADLPLAISTGDPVTAEMLDEAIAINSATNTAAIAAAIDYASYGRSIVRLAGATYNVNDTLRPKYGINIKGKRGYSRIRMDSSVGREIPVIKTGSVTERARDVTLEDFIVDFNYDRIANDFGAVVDVSNGTAVCVINTDTALLSGLEIYDTFKHCVDVTGAVYSLDSTIKPYSYQKSRNILVKDCVAEGNGDDAFTSHMCDGVVFDNCRHRFSTALYVNVTRNSNGFEIDDYSVNVDVLNCRSEYSYYGVLVKAHSVAAAPRNVRVDGFYAGKTVIGYSAAHDDHDQTTISPSAHDVVFNNIVVTDAREWFVSTGRLVGGHCYAYQGVKMSNISIRQGNALPNIYDKGTGNDSCVMLLQSGLRDVLMNNIDIQGFPDSESGIYVTATSAGRMAINNLMVTDGPIIGLLHGGGAKLAVNNVILQRASLVGSIGIKGLTASTKIGGEVWADGYATPTSLT